MFHFTNFCTPEPCVCQLRAFTWNQPFSHISISTAQPLTSAALAFPSTLSFIAPLLPQRDKLWGLLSTYALLHLVILSLPHAHIHTCKCTHTSTAPWNVSSFHFFNLECLVIINSSGSFVTWHKLSSGQCILLTCRYSECVVLTLPDSSESFPLLNRLRSSGFGWGVVPRFWDIQPKCLSFEDSFTLTPKAFFF